MSKNIKKISVEQFEVKNQFLIRTDDGIYFQSYNSIIAFKRRGQVYLDEYYWDYSVTTGRYRNLFLGDDSIKETRKRIASGEYKLVNLN